MSFTVNRNDGNLKDAEFEAYARCSTNKALISANCRARPTRRPGDAGYTYGTLKRKLGLLPRS
jgi:hypothetical protein